MGRGRANLIHRLIGEQLKSYAELDSDFHYFIGIRFNFYYKIQKRYKNKIIPVSIFLIQFEAFTLMSLAQLK